MKKHFKVKLFVVSFLNDNSFVVVYLMPGITIVIILFNP